MKLKNKKRSQSKSPRPRQLSMRSRVDRGTVEVESLDRMTSDVEFWLKRPVAERWAAVQLLREINYGPAASGRLQRVLEVVTRPPG